MSTVRAILGNTIAQIGGKVVTAAVSIVIIKLITTYLGRAGYGEYTAIYEFLAFFGIVADFGIFQIAVREMSHHYEKRAEIFGNVLLLRLVLTIFSMLVAITAVYLIPKYDVTKIPLGVAIASITTFLTLIHGTLSSALQTELKIQWSVLAQIIGKILTFAYMLWAVFIAFPQDQTTGFYHLIVAGNVGSVIMVIQTYYYTRKVIPVRLSFNWQYWKDVLIKAIPYGTAVIFATIYFRIGAFFLTLFRSTDEVGIYGVAMRIVENTQMLPAFFMSAALPVLTRYLITDRQKFAKAFQYSFDFLFLIGLPIVLGGVVLAYPLVAVISSPEFLSKLSSGFYGSDIALQLLLPAMFCAFFGNLFNYTLLAANEQRKILIFTFTAAVLNVVTNFFAIAEFGFRGAAVVSIATEFFVAAAGFYFVTKTTTAKLSLKTSFKGLLAGGVMVAVILLLQPVTYDLMQNWNILVLVPLGGVIYLTLLFLTKAITPEMLALLKRQPSAINLEQV